MRLSRGRVIIYHNSSGIKLSHPDSYKNDHTRSELSGDCNLYEPRTLESRGHRIVLPSQHKTAKTHWRGEKRRRFFWKQSGNTIHNMKVARRVHFSFTDSSATRVNAAVTSRQIAPPSPPHPAPPTEGNIRI